MATTFQLLMRGLDGRTSCLRFPSSTITGALIQRQIASIFHLPTEAVLILTGTTLVYPHTSLSAGSDGLFPSCSLLLRLRGGKGGFGSLLRGAATKAGQKKTSNFDACRDMSGRRLRHVNAEKKLKEWKAQAKERELEKAANEFLKKQVKRKEDDSGCSQVIEKFREETSRAREEVESAVAKGLAEAKRFGKRKVVENDSLPASSSKRAHIWLDNEIDMVEEDETDSSDDDAEETEEGLDNEDADKGSSDVKTEEGSEEVQFEEVKFEEDTESGKPEEVPQYARVEESFETEKQPELEKADEMYGEEHCNGCHSAQVDKIVHLKEVIKGDVSSSIVAMHGDQKLLGKNEPGTNNLYPEDFGLQRGGNDSSVNREQAQEDLNLSDFHQASELEVLGLERLKHELQKRGLKCGGSLAERAGRLFLLKTVPLEKLDKKHFAKARA